MSRTIIYLVAFSIVLISGEGSAGPGTLYSEPYGSSGLSGGKLLFGIIIFVALVFATYCLPVFRETAMIFGAIMIPIGFFSDSPGSWFFVLLGFALLAAGALSIKNDRY